MPPVPPADARHGWRPGPKISRISAVRSITLQPVIISRLRCCTKGKGGVDDDDRVMPVLFRLLFEHIGIASSDKRRRTGTVQRGDISHDHLQTDRLSKTGSLFKALLGRAWQRFKAVIGMNDESGFLTHGGEYSQIRRILPIDLPIPASVFMITAMSNPVPVKIDIFSDIICPWCFIGKKRLEMAAELHGGVDLNITWRAFLLNPGMRPGGMDRKAYLEAKFGAAATSFYDRIALVGDEIGIPFAFDRIEKTPDSRPAQG